MANYRYVVDGNEYWYEDDVPHRIDGPAVIMADGGQLWWADGRLHRQSGPAIILPSGYSEWWIDGVQVTRTHLRKLDLQEYPKEGFTDDQAALLRIMR